MRNRVYNDQFKICIAELIKRDSKYFTSAHGGGLAGHFMGDAEAYRPEGEKESLGLRDPIPAFRALLQKEGVTSAQLDSMEKAAEAEVAEAITFARDSDYAPVEDALTHVFA